MAGGLLLVALAAIAFLYFTKKSNEYVSPQAAAIQALTEASASQPVFLFQDGFPTGVATSVQVAGADPVERARNFLDTYRDLYLFSDEELTLMPYRVQKSYGDTAVFSQAYRGLPVFGAQLAITLDSDIVRGTTGALLFGDITLDTIPTITPDEAIGLARQALHLPEPKIARQPELMIFDLALLSKEASDPHLVYLLDLETSSLQLRAFIDAHNGELVNSYYLTEPALNYEIWDGQGLPLGDCVTTLQNSILLGTESEPLNIPAASAESLTLDANRAQASYEDTYNFYLDSFSRDGFDGKGSNIVLVLRLPGGGVNYGCFITFSPQWTILDIMAHEITHSVVGSTSGLAYLGESGALNESFADIMASFIDGNWTIAEDIGAFRSLANPPIYSHPDKYSGFMGSPGTDNGGVHTNSGIMNKAAYLITEGGAFNGATITGLGADKAADLFYTSMVTLTYNADLRSAAFHTRFIVAPFFLSIEEICHVHNAFFAVELIPYPIGCAAPDAHKDSDLDYAPDLIDNCPGLANNQNDLDKDGLGNDCDKDIDGDGAPEKVGPDSIFVNLDNCPELANPDQTDKDGDGLGTLCDPEEKDLASSPSPTPVPDFDKDRVPDAQDNCPNKKNPEQKNFDNDSQGDACDDDKDNDGQHDYWYGGDNCFYAPNKDQADIDGDGIGDACEWDESQPKELSFENRPGDLVSVAIPLCASDQNGWYSEEFTVAIQMQGLGAGVGSWVSATARNYLTTPQFGGQQLHAFTPHMGEQYVLNFAFDDNIPAGQQTIALQMQCGLYTELDLSGFTSPTQTEAPTPTPDLSGLTLPYLTLLQNGNCRTNPGPDYEVLDLVPTGFQATINGVVPDNAWLRIFLPDWNQNCWVSASVVEVTGDLTGVTVYQYAPPPTATTDPDEGNNGVSSPTPSGPQCSDGVDNDGDGVTDLLDPQCGSTIDNDESS